MGSSPISRTKSRHVSINKKEEIINKNEGGFPDAKLYEPIFLFLIFHSSFLFERYLNPSHKTKLIAEKSPFM